MAPRPGLAGEEAEGGRLSPTRPRRVSRDGVRAGAADPGPTTPLEGLGVRAGQEGVSRRGIRWKRQGRKKRGSYFINNKKKKSGFFSCSAPRCPLAGRCQPRSLLGRGGLLPPPPGRVQAPSPAAAWGSPAQAEGKGGDPKASSNSPRALGAGVGGGHRLQKRWAMLAGDDGSQSPAIWTGPTFNKGRRGGGGRRVPFL